MGQAISTKLLGLGTDADAKKIYKKWVTKKEVVTLKKNCLDTVNGLVTRVTLVSGCLGLLLTKIWPCPPLGFLIWVIFAAMAANLTIKTNTIAALEELGEQLAEEYQTAYNQVKHAKGVPQGTEPLILPNGFWWVLPYTIEAFGVAAFYIGAEIAFACGLNKCNLKK